MEAIEFAVAEYPLANRTIASINELTKAGQDFFLPTRLLPRNHVLAPDDPISWLTGSCLVSGASVLVPLDSAALAPNSVETQPFAQSSNGLGAGFTPAEAIVHALCECVERDASSLWSLRSFRTCAATEIDVSTIADTKARQCVTKVSEAGFSLKLFDLTNDLGLPVIMALLWSGRPSLYFDVASGVCAHPSSARAIAGAIEEAAQTRISNIAGARDDIDPAEYGAPLPAWIRDLIGAKRSGTRAPPQSMHEERFCALPGRIGGRLVAVSLAPPDDKVEVVKILSETLEDRSTNAHWRPGPRAIRAMTSP